MRLTLHAEAIARKKCHAIKSRAEFYANIFLLKQRKLLKMNDRFRTVTQLPLQLQSSQPK